MNPSMENKYCNYKNCTYDLPQPLGPNTMNDCLDSNHETITSDAVFICAVRTRLFDVRLESVTCTSTQSLRES